MGRLQEGGTDGEGTAKDLVQVQEDSLVGGWEVYGGEQGLPEPGRGQDWAISQLGPKCKAFDKYREKEEQILRRESGT